MTGGLVAAVLVGCAVIAAAGLVQAAAGKEPGRRLLQALFGLQALLLAQLGYSAVRLLENDRPAEPGSFAAYAVLSLLLLPGALALTVDERTRWASVVVAVACVTTAVVESRLVTTWS